MKVEAQDIIYMKNLGNLWFDTLPREGEFIKLKDEKGFTTTYKVHSIVHAHKIKNLEHYTNFVYNGENRSKSFEITLNLEPI